MNVIIGWVLAGLALVVGWRSYGWQGVVFAVTLVAFWLLMQFNRSVKALRVAADSPVGHVDSAVMLNAKLKKGLPMTQVVMLTKSLGTRVPEAAGDAAGASDSETWTWADNAGSVVRIVFVRGRCASWTLERPATE